MWGFALFSLTDCWSEYAVFPSVHAERLFLFHYQTVVVSVVGCGGVVLATIGPRTTQGLSSPVQVVKCLFGLQESSGWSSDCIGVVMRA